MSEVPFTRSEHLVRPGFLETLVYRLLVVSLMIVSALSISIGRLFGAKRQGSIWREAKQTAYAVAGYAFKY